jgi:hypothetical protein
LDDLRKDYDLKMAIINEINEEKKIREKYEYDLKDYEHRKRHEELKTQAV